MSARSPISASVTAAGFGVVEGGMTAVGVFTVPAIFTSETTSACCNIWNQSITNYNSYFFQGCGSGSGWIRIHLGLWIQNRMRFWLVELLKDNFWSFHSICCFSLIIFFYGKLFFMSILYYSMHLIYVVIIGKGGGGRLCRIVVIDNKNLLFY